MHQNNIARCRDLNIERYDFIMVETQTRQKPDSSGDGEHSCACWNMESVKTGACIPPVLLQSRAKLTQLHPSAAKWLQQVWASAGPYADKKLPLTRSRAYTEHMTRTAKCHPIFQRAISNLQRVAEGLQLSDITVLLFLVVHAAQTQL